MLGRGQTQDLFAGDLRSSHVCKQSNNVRHHFQTGQTERFILKAMVYVMYTTTIVIYTAINYYQILIFGSENESVLF